MSIGKAKSNYTIIFASLEEHKSSEEYAQISSVMEETELIKKYREFLESFMQGHDEDSQIVYTRT
jgi:hypothetical protein